MEKQKLTMYLVIFYLFMPFSLQAMNKMKDEEQKINVKILQEEIKTFNEKYRESFEQTNKFAVSKNEVANFYGSVCSHLRTGANVAVATLNIVMIFSMNACTSTQELLGKYLCLGAGYLASNWILKSKGTKFEKLEEITLKNHLLIDDIFTGLECYEEDVEISADNLEKYIKYATKNRALGKLLIDIKSDIYKKFDAKISLGTAFLLVIKAMNDFDFYKHRKEHCGQMFEPEKLSKLALVYWPLESN